MPILQFQCQECSSVFEQLISRDLADLNIDCVSCGSEKISRAAQTYFYPNKTFCPHDKELDQEQLKSELATILLDRSKQCGGCGTDGAAGRCGSKGGGCSCGAGGCGSGDAKKPSGGCRPVPRFAKLLQ